MGQKLTEMHKDFLKEIASIGAGNASTLLSKLTGKEINMTVSTFDMASPQKMAKIVNASRRLVVVQYASIGGELGGTVLLVFPRESALSLVDLLQRREPGTTEWLSKEDQDTLKRVSRCLVMCYLDAIKGFLNIRLQPSELRIFSTFGETIMDLIDLALKKKTEQVFYLDTKLSVKPNIEGGFNFLLDENLSSFLLEKSAKMLAE